MAENPGPPGPPPSDSESETGLDSDNACDIGDTDSMGSPSTSTANELDNLDSSCSNSTATVTSLLDRLREPRPSHLARKRIIGINRPKAAGKKRGRGCATNDPKSVSPAARVKAYPNEPLTVSNKKLFCSGCREQLSVKKSSLELHIKSLKHVKGKERLASKEKRQLDISKSLKQYDNEVHPSGETLPQSTRVYRVNVVTALLKAGVCLSKSDSIRDLLEEYAYALTNSTHLRHLVPFILQDEISKLKQDISGRHVAIIFDGTTNVCEAFVIVLRYVDKEFVIQQRVCRLMLLAKSITGEEVARQLIVALSTELSIASNLVIAAMRDRASVNNVAMRTISVLYNDIMDIGCFSHTLDHVGERMKTPILDDFTKAWISLFAHSPKSRLAWRTQTGLSTPSYSATRWWSRFEVIHQLLNTFGDLPAFLHDSDLPPATTGKLLQILDDEPTCRKLKMELAIVVDSMEPFVKATYSLEGDGPLVLVAYQRLSLLYSHISSEHYPNVAAVAKLLSRGNSARERQLIAYAKACCVHAYSYFKEKFDNDLRPIVLAFKAARYFSPSKVNELKPTAVDIDSLTAFPFLNSEVIDGLKSELPEYLAAAEDVSDKVDVIEWWKSHEESGRLPNWTRTCRLVFLVQPSSAAAERVFSLLTNSFSPQQETSLEDYKELSVMLQYNYRKK